MSAASSHRRGGAPAGRSLARDAAFAAVLERRGRFLVAERLFPPVQPPDGPPARRSARMVVRAGRSGREQRASPGELVLVAPAARGSTATVLRVIGRPHVARDVIEALMLDRGLRREFDQALEREAREAAAGEARAGHPRRDLRELPTFTIDPASARDFDDAISAQALGADRVRVWVHIADVAAHVPAGSPLDREARRRATSVYVPGAVEPMLPHALSSDACSLMPGQERAAVTVELDLHGASVASAAFYRSLIRSDERLDYERVDRIFAGCEQAAAPWGEPLAAARAAAAALARARRGEGALVIDSEEPEFAFDERGAVSAVEPRSQTESHRLIEHLMIAANEAVATLLEQRGVPCLYRVHERPDPERIERLVEQLASLDVPTPPLPEQLSSTQAAQLVGAISAKVDEHVRRSGRGRIALSSLVLRSLKQAYYSPRNLGHAGLRLQSYCHFTSPIRRYPDLVCHRALLSAVAGETAPRAAELGELGVWTSERERVAAKIEQDGDDIARCFFLERVLYERGPDTTFAGEVSGLIAAGAFVAFDRDSSEQSGEAAREPLFEGMLPLRALRAGGGEAPRSRSPRGGQGARGGGRELGEREWWELNEQGTILHGERGGSTLRLGDPIEVAVVRVDTVRGRVDLACAG